MKFRLSEIREARGLTLEDVAAQLDVAISTVSRWEVGDTNIPTKRFEEIAEAYRCAVSDFFETREIKSPAAPIVPDTPPTHGASDGDGAVYLTQVDLGYSMGTGSTIEDYPEAGQLQFDPNLLRTLTRSPPDRLFVARGQGDSMMPTLIDNDTVVIDTLQRNLNLQDRIWACSVHGAGAIKRLRSIGKQRVLVISDNPTVENQEVDAEDLFIVGRVIWVGRRV